MTCYGGREKPRAEKGQTAKGLMYGNEGGKTTDWDLTRVIGGEVGWLADGGEVKSRWPEGCLIAIDHSTSRKF